MRQMRSLVWVPDEENTGSTTKGYRNRTAMAIKIAHSFRNNTVNFCLRIAVDVVVVGPAP